MCHYEYFQISEKDEKGKRRVFPDVESFAVACRTIGSDPPTPNITTTQSVTVLTPRTSETTSSDTSVTVW